MKATIKDLLESMIDEYLLDEDSRDSIVYDYADRIFDLFVDENDENDYGFYLPETELYID